MVVEILTRVIQVVQVEQIQVAVEELHHIRVVEALEMVVQALLLLDMWWHEQL